MQLTGGRRGRHHSGAVRATQAVFSEWSYWADIVANLPSDDAAAVQEFLSKVDAVPGPAPEHGHNGMTHTLDEGTRESVRIGIRADAQHIREALQNGAHDSTWIRRNILAHYAALAASAKPITVDDAIRNLSARLGRPPDFRLRPQPTPSMRQAGKKR